MSEPPRSLRPGDRTAFPSLEARAYLHWAGVAPPSIWVEGAVREALSDHARRGASAYARWEAERAELRSVLAALIGAEAEEIAFVPNTTEAAFDVAFAFPWSEGDRILVFDGEFPANVVPWQRAAERFGLGVRFLSLEAFHRSPEEGLEVLGAALEEGARLLAVSLVQFSTGLRMPVEAMAALCHAHGAEIFVDGIQGVGLLPLAVGASGIDYLGCGGHKWLMGVSGAGFLFVSRRRAGALRSSMAGWSAHPHALDFLSRGAGHLRYDVPPPRTAPALERGSPNVLGYAALHASASALLELGTEQISAHVARYLDRLEPALVDRGFRSLRPARGPSRAGILSVLPPDGIDAMTLHGALTRAGIACGFPDGRIRFAPHVPNPIEEVDDVLAAVDDALASMRT